MKYGYPPVILPVEERVAYYEALQKYDNSSNTDDFMKILVCWRKNNYHFIYLY
jgi:hypothetical protein